MKRLRKDILMNPAEQRLENLLVPVKLAVISMRGGPAYFTFSTSHTCLECGVQREPGFPFFQCPACKRYVCLICSEFRRNVYDQWLICPYCKRDLADTL